MIHLLKVCDYEDSQGIKVGPGFTGQFSKIILRNVSCSCQQAKIPLWNNQAIPGHISLQKVLRVSQLVYFQSVPNDPQKS